MARRIEWYPAPAEPPRRVPVALWQLLAVFVLFIILLLLLT